MRRIHTDKAPKAIGPYSQAVSANGILYCSGQIAIVPETGEILRGSATEQCTQVLKNLKEVLEAGGSSLEQVVKCTVYLSSMELYTEVNEVYSQVFASSRPARVAIAAAGLPAGVDVEIDAIAVVG